MGLDVSRSLAPQGPGYGVGRPSGVFGLGAGTQALWGQELRGVFRRPQGLPEMLSAGRAGTVGWRLAACPSRQSADQSRDRVRGLDHRRGRPGPPRSARRRAPVVRAGLGSPSTRGCAPASSRASASSSRSTTCRTRARRSVRGHPQPAPAARRGDRQRQGALPEHAGGHEPGPVARRGARRCRPCRRTRGAATPASGRTYSPTSQLDRLPADRHPVLLVVDGELSEHERLRRLAASERPRGPAPPARSSRRARRCSRPRPIRAPWRRSRRGRSRR